MIRHFLADGREVESIEGFIVPREGATEAAYRILAEFAKKRQRTTNEKEGITDAATSA